jgi:hypothetical protein
MPDQLLSISTDKNDYGQIRVLSASSDAPHNRVPSSNVVPRSNPLTRGDTGRRGRPEATDVSDSSAGLSFNRGQDCCRQWQRNATEPAQDMGATLPFVNVLPRSMCCSSYLVPQRNSSQRRIADGYREAENSRRSLPAEQSQQSLGVTTQEMQRRVARAEETLTTHPRSFLIDRAITNSKAAR